MAIQSFLPIMRWRDVWREPGTLRADALAGLTGAVVVLPQGMAFATLAGMPAQYGLYAAMLPCVVAALFGSSRLMVSGPANAISLTTLALMSPLAEVGSDDYVRLVLTLSFCVGLLQLLLGLARVGDWVERVPHSVVVGFTTGAAVLIVNSQVGPLLGLALPRGQAIWTQLAQAIDHARDIYWPAPLVASTTAVVAWLARPWGRWVPAMLLAVCAGSLLGLALTHWVPDAPALARVQPLASAWPSLSTPDLRLDTLRSLFGPTLVMTLLGLTEASAIARAVARRHQDRLDGNQEFIGQGLANLAGAFSSAYPVSGSFNRSGVNMASGARTPLSAVIAACCLVLILWAVAPLATYLPLAVIAGLLLVVAAGLVDGPDIRAQWKHPEDRLPMVVTALATVTLSLEWAIVLGIVTALLMRRNAHS